ncbi:TPA: hypothetical protein JLK75_004812 [Escherichia coli]|nr:hypothetical protein [Escherichia coli]
MRKYIFFLFFFTFQVAAYDPCRDMQLLWQLDGTAMSIPPVTISSGNSSSYFDVTFPGLSPTAPGVITWLQRNNVPEDADGTSMGNGEKNIVTWLGIPVTDDLSFGNGLKGRIELISGGYAKRGVYNGIQTYSGGYRTYDWKWNFPNRLVVGSRYPNVENNFNQTKIRVYIEKGSAFSGTYHINLPLKVGSEEWYRGEKVCSTGADIEKAVTEMGDLFSDITVNVIASCKVNTQTVSIEHNTITADQARNGHKASAKLDITCSSPTMIKLLIKGTDVISGEPSNTTRCGIDGKCTLTVDSKKEFYGEVSGSKSFNIESLYQPTRADGINAGAFSGNAVVTALMQ